MRQSSEEQCQPTPSLDHAASRLVKRFSQKEVVASLDIVVFPFVFGLSFVVEFDVFLAAGFKKLVLVVG